MFIVLKKKTVLLTAICLIGLLSAGVAFGALYHRKPSAVSVLRKTVVVDAGHGGPDRGVVGKGGTEEADKNLEIAFLLRGVLTDAGYDVVMTRTTDEGADEPTGSFKSEDFARRKKIIERAAPDAVVSVHCNKFPATDRRGAQVFYNAVSREGKALADGVQDCLNALNERHVGKTFAALSGEYYMLNCSSCPSVIVECGFLSNPDDEALLGDEAYLSDLVAAILGGVAGYFA